ncbi:MAG: biotin/lipoyl-binding protein [Actinomycetota bacterium]|nr:biotin/lipoyl-binding protein [Actinomycetota bacterium]
MTRHTLPGNFRRRLAAAAALSVSVALVVSACSGSAPPPPTARVERGMVATKVSASGALASISSQNLGFPKGAPLKEVNVKVGDVVKAGQVLAKLDDFTFQQLLNQQQAQLNNQQALLNKLTGGNTVEQAKRSLDQSQDILDATRKNVDAQQRLDDATVNRTQIADDNAQRQQQQAQRNLDFCRSHGPSAMSPAPPVGGSNLPGTSPSYRGTSPSYLGPGVSGVIPNQSTGRPDRDGVLGRNPGDAYSPQQGGADPCTAQVESLNLARTNAINAKTAAVQARKQRNVDQTQGQVSIEQAKQTVVTNKNNLDTAGNDNPANIDAQRALVANAVALVVTARRDVEDTVLRAPLDGTIATINGAVGEFVGSEAALTSQAPGTSAAIPGVGAAATSTQNQVSISTNGSRNGGAFITLNNVDTFQVVVPFVESDAAKVSVNQPVEVTFDAIPDLTRQGKVLSIAPAGTDISGVTNYYATVVLTETDPRLRDGQTAAANVLTSSKDNVLVVPNNAVTKQGGKSFVSTPGPGGQPVQTPFQPGVVGDDKTEVLSGLSEGQEIILPQAQVNATPGGGGGGIGGGRRGGN